MPRVTGSDHNKFVQALHVGDCSETKMVVGYDNTRPRHKIYDLQCLKCGDIISTAVKAFNKNCKKCGSWGPVGDKKSKRETTAPERQLWNKYKHGAKDRFIEFSISDELFAEIVHQKCFYCGKSPTQIMTLKRLHNNTLIYNGVDRFDNTQGYTKENCVPCCWECNQAKRNYSIDTWISMVTQWSERIDKWQEKKSTEH